MTALPDTDEGYTDESYAVEQQFIAEYPDD